MWILPQKVDRPQFSGTQKGNIAVFISSPKDKDNISFLLSPNQVTLHVDTYGTANHAIYILGDIWHF